MATDSSLADPYPWDSEDNPNASDWIALDRAIIDAALKVLHAGQEAEEEPEGNAIIASNMLYQLRDLLLFSPMTIIDGNRALDRYLPLYLEKATPELSGYLRAVANRDGKPVDDLIQFLLQWIDTASFTLTFAGPTTLISEKHAIERWNARLVQISNEAKTSLNSARFAHKAAEAARSAERASVAAREAAGSAGNSALAFHFAELAQRESRAAFGWTFCTIVALMVTITAGTILSVNKVFDSLWSSIIGHLAVILPIVAIAAYTARIAHHHRKSALWSSSASVQLKSIAAYAEQLGSDDSRENILIALGNRVFSAPDVTDATPTDQVSLVPPALVELVRELVSGMKQDSPGKNSPSA